MQIVAILHCLGEDSKAQLYRKCVYVYVYVRMCIYIHKNLWLVKSEIQMCICGLT